MICGPNKKADTPDARRIPSKAQSPRARLLMTPISSMMLSQQVAIVVFFRGLRLKVVVIVVVVVDAIAYLARYRVMNSVCPLFVTTVMM